jgi:two-component system, LytTR family, sensor kinase
MATRPIAVSLYAGFWTAVALVFVVPKLGQTTDWGVTVLAALAQWWSWGLLAPVIIAVDRRLPFSNRRLALRVSPHFVLGPVFTVMYAYLAACVAAVMSVGTWARLLDTEVLTEAWHEMFWSMLVYGLIVGVWEAYQYELRMQRLERSFAEARLNSLRMQLDPHFLFNALNTISAHAEREPRLARKMIEHLGDLLRHSLTSRSRPVVPLAEELACLDHYLAIQKIRFGERLRVQTQASGDVSHALVPSLFLQPLVENAIRHGLAPRSTGGTIIINVERAAGDTLHVEIVDDGVGLPPVWPPENQVGLGLSVTRERIAGLHPPGSSRFTVQRRAAGGTTVDILFPLRFSEGLDG